jgi:hypothetical protein
VIEVLKGDRTLNEIAADGNDSIKDYIADSKGILKPVLFTAFTGNKLGTVASVFTKNTDWLVRDITSWD